MRSVILALLALPLAAPAAQASVADGWLPIKDADDGVHAVASAKRGHAIRFGPAAARLYSSIRGRATATCLNVSPSPGEPTAEINGEGNLGKLPRRRGTGRLGALARGDVCAIQSRRTMNDDCVPIGDREDLCPRVIVAYSTEGRAYLDSAARRFEITKVSDLAAALPRDTL